MMSEVSSSRSGFKNSNTSKSKNNSKNKNNNGKGLPTSDNSAITGSTSIKSPNSGNLMATNSPYGPGAIPLSSGAANSNVFNPSAKQTNGRQDSIGNLVNGYNNYQYYPNYPSYGSNSMVPSQSREPSSGTSDVRPRGDSIYLPPPMITSQFNKYANIDETVGPGVPIPGGSRSNSIFNLFNLNPSDKKRLSSADNMLLQDFENYLNTYGSQNVIPQGTPIGINNSGSIGGTTNPGSTNKDSLSNLLQFPFNTSRSNSQSRKDSKSSKHSSIDFSNSGSWEGLNMFGGNPSNQNYQNQSGQNLMFSNNGNLSTLLQSLSNSIDFSNMSQEQRRDSIIRYFNDPNFRNSLSQQTPLKEDIFSKEDPKSDIMNDSNKLTVPRMIKSDSKNQPLSPTSSLSSKSETKYEVPQSPKTSPGEAKTNQYTNNPGNSGYYNIPPNQGQLLMQPSGQMGSPQQQYYRSTQYSPQYIAPNYTNYNYPPAPPPGNQTSVPSVSGQRVAKVSPQKTPQGDLNSLEKTEQPRLGATKIDQLMLVIQARDEANKDIKIHTNEDGNIIGEVKPQHLVGGVEKNKLIPEASGSSDDGTDATHERKKHHRKLPQCPYCEKFFAQSTQLEVHIRSHIGLKPFECTYCHKRFTQGGNLTTHLRLHTGEKPFACEVCHKSFSRKGNLAAHKLTHEKLKPFDCKLDGCDKAFTQLGNLKSHQNKFHLNTLNSLTMKLAELSSAQIANLPSHEKELLDYFKNLYKNSNKGIKGRGKRETGLHDSSDLGAGPTGSESSTSFRASNYDQFV